MAAREFSSVTLEAEHIPETHRTLENDHTISEQDLPGVVNVYLVIDGARLLFTQYKASKVFDVLDAYQAQTQAEQTATPAPQAAPAQTAPAPTPPEQSAPPEQTPQV